MKFVCDFELCSMVFLLIVMFFYFTRKRFASTADRVFSAFLIATMTTLILDVIASMQLNFGSRVPVALHYAANVLFYCSQIFVPFFGFLYAIAIIDKYDGKINRRIRLFSIPLFVQIVFAVLSPVFGFYFSIDANGAFQYGPLHIFHYILPVFYLILSSYVTFRYIKAITTLQLFAVVSLLVSCMVFTVIEYFFPKYLIVNMAGVLSAFLMYLSLQNPASNVDTLTGLFNSTAFTRFIYRSYIEKKKYTLFIIRISDLKLLNNSFGVDNCDKILREISEYIKDREEVNMLFRITGGSFGAVVYGKTQANMIQGILKKRFEEPWEIDEIKVALNLKTIRIDVPEHAINAEKLMYNINYCMYMMENSSSALIVMDETIEKRISEEAELEQAVRRAIKSESFKILYQPVYSVAENRFVAVEALARISDERFGDILPEVFLPVAEREGFLLQLGRIVAERVCEFINGSNFEKLGLSYVSINLSSVECMQENAAGSLSMTMERYGINPKLIHFEINETTATNAFEQLRYSMFRMLELGCDFALDDFGTGYSNLSGAIELPFSMVKLDRTIISYYENPEKAKAVTGSVIEMLKDLGLDICAEGVENSEQYETMKQLGVGYMQGYYFAEPLDEIRIKEFLNESKGGIKA